MISQKTQIKEGIKFHKIETNKFKTNLFAIFFSLPINRETVTKNALLVSILRRGTKDLKSQEEISKELEEMYGASFDCGIEKSGDLHTMKFYLEVISDEFLPEKENLSKKALELLLSIAFNPYIENEAFKEEYIKQEKENLKQIIEGKIDNKASYALERCIEEMYKDKPYGLYKYGYIEDLENISSKELYKYYQEFVAEIKWLEEKSNEELVKGNDAQSSYYLGEIAKLKQNSFIDAMASANIIPRYGFPIDCINLKVAKDVNKVDLNRDLQIALSEYAPDCEVIANGRKYTSRYIIIPKNKEMTKYYYFT